MLLIILGWEVDTLALKLELLEHQQHELLAILMQHLDYFCMCIRN
jgi:hypothetical protein